MRFLHTSDLHIGKTINDFSMLEDQKFVLRQLRDIAVQEKVDGIVIAGDIYDRAIPTTEAVSLLNDFLTQLSREEIPVILISGNHDSLERVSFGEEILEKQAIHIAGNQWKSLKQVSFQDEYGTVHFILLPFVRPAVVGKRTSEEAVQDLLAPIGVNRNMEDRYVLVTHFFVTDGSRLPELSDGETTIHVGGIDQVEACHFSMFDYVALGHIHKHQKIGPGEVYYAGAPLKYSFSESTHTKSVHLVELKEKGVVHTRIIPIKPLHEMRKIKGRLEELIKEDVVEPETAQDYIQATLTNQEELLDPMSTLRSVYPNVMQIQLSKNEISGQELYQTRSVMKGKNILELFQEFYQIVRKEDITQEQIRYVLEEIDETN